MAAPACLVDQASKARVQRSFAEVQKSKSAGTIVADSKPSAKAGAWPAPVQCARASSVLTSVRAGVRTLCADCIAAEAAPPSPSKPSAAAPATVESPGERETASPGLSRAEVAARLKQAGRLGGTKKAEPKPVAEA